MSELNKDNPLPMLLDLPYPFFNKTFDEEKEYQDFLKTQFIFIGGNNGQNDR